MDFPPAVTILRECHRTVEIRALLKRRRNYFIGPTYGRLLRQVSERCALAAALESSCKPDELCDVRYRGWTTKGRDSPVHPLFMRSSSRRPLTSVSEAAIYRNAATPLLHGSRELRWRGSWNRPGMGRRCWANRHRRDRMGANAPANLIDFLILVRFLLVAHNESFSRLPAALNYRLMLL